MSADPLLGEIMTVGFNFAPRGWATCSGQLLPIAQNTALFSLLGTTYGGDGRTTFGLPDLRGRSMRGVGSGPGLTTIPWGARFGAQFHVLNRTELPSNLGLTATLYGETALADSPNPLGNMLATHVGYAAPVSAENKAMSSESIQIRGGGANLDFNLQGPSLGIYMCIAMQGIFPSRN